MLYKPGPAIKPSRQSVGRARLWTGRSLRRGPWTSRGLSPGRKSAAGVQMRLLWPASSPQEMNDTVPLPPVPRAPTRWAGWGVVRRGECPQSSRWGTGVGTVRLCWPGSWWAELPCRYLGPLSCSFPDTLEAWVGCDFGISDLATLDQFSESSQGQDLVSSLRPYLRLNSHWVPGGAACDLPLPKLSVAPSPSALTHLWSGVGD